jgi:hypothetical protein
MFSWIKKLFATPSNDYLVEGMWADDYTASPTRIKIAQDYRKKFPVPVETPVTHPWKYDPLNPPDNWKYDPYYELWYTKE